MKRYKVVHLLIESSHVAGRDSLWCSKDAPLDNKLLTTQPSAVTCKHCIKAGGCGPGWKP